MILEILTPDKALFSGEVESVMLPGSLGVFEILNNHAPIVSRLKAGTVKITSKEGIQNFEIKGGIVEMLDNKIVVLA
ncbi:MAG: ATP synthase F1 subunit epsilon [Bacteroidota bacterium]|nr:ATP synthase F1 subunit epsilon [Bacteroidota bacterium]